MARLRGPRLWVAASGVLAALLLFVVPAPQAHAGPPDRWGFGYLDNPTPPPGYPLALQASSTGMTAIITAYSAPNHYRIFFPGLGIAGVPDGVVHVTAVSAPAGLPSWCEPDHWQVAAGGFEQIDVSCYRAPGGIPTASGFSVSYAARYDPPSGPGYAYAESDGGPGQLAAFSSTGSPIVISWLPPGHWQVRLVNQGGVGTAPPQDGGFQVTAVGPIPAHCSASAWSTSIVPPDQFVDVFCYDASGNPVNTPWTLTYQNRRDILGQTPIHFGYLLKPAAPPPSSSNYNSLTSPHFGQNWAAAISPPTSFTVVFPQLPVPPDNAQVTAYGSGPQFCRFGLPASPPWYDNGGSLVVRSVDCFNGTVPVSADFLVTYNSAS